MYNVYNREPHSASLGSSTVQIWLDFLLLPLDQSYRAAFPDVTTTVVVLGLVNLTFKSR